MAFWTNYKTRPKLMDVTVTACGANQTDFALPVSGSTTGTNAASMTDTNVTSLVPQGQVADALLVVVTSPIVSATSFPDVELWFANGSDNQRGRQVFDVGFQANMLPALQSAEFNPEVAQTVLLLGMSTRDTLRQHKALLEATGEGIPNLPTLITGYKVPYQLQAHIASSAGWTSSAIIPMRVEVYADFLTQEDLDELGRVPYDGRIYWDVPPAVPFSAVHTWPGLGTIAGWKAGPGGTGQGSVKVHRRIAYCYNGVAITGQYAFSDQNGVKGATGNSSSADTTNGKNNYHDLGEVLKESNDATFVDRLGVNLYNSGDNAYVGWLIDGQVVPQETTNGKRVSYAHSSLGYGAASTATGVGTRVKTLPNVDNLARVLMHKNNVTPVANIAGSTTSIGAGNMSVAYSGVKVEVA